MGDGSCVICQKHRGEGPLVGPLIYQNALLFVSHRAAGSLGYVFIETKRHVPSLHQLTDAEAEAVGRTTARLARGLWAELEVENVHSMVAGLGVARAHFHQHVFVRHAGTPSGNEWWEQWPDAPRGDIEHLAHRLGGYLQTG